MKKLLLALLFIPYVASADVIKFAWDAVTTDISGAPAVITGYNLYTSKTSGTYTTTPASSVAVPETSLTITEIGTYYAVATAVSVGGESTYSNEVTFTITNKPTAPKNLKVSR